MKRFRNWKIQTKLVVTMLLVVFAPMVLVATLSLQRFSDSLRDNSEQNLEQIVADVLTTCRLLVEASDHQINLDMKTASQYIAGLGPLGLSDAMISPDGHPGILMPELIAGKTPLSQSSGIAEKIHARIGETFVLYQFGADGALYRLAGSYQHDLGEELTEKRLTTNHQITLRIARNRTYKDRYVSGDRSYTLAYSPLTDEQDRVVGALVVGEEQRGVIALQNAIKRIRVGDTGYAYTMHRNGVLEVHPAQSGRNILDSQDSAGNFYIREMCENAPTLSAGGIGTIRYPWINPELGETMSRTKITKYAYFEPWDWIIAAGSYESEIYAASQRTKQSILVVFGLTAVIVLLMTLGIARRLTRPLRRMSRASERMAGGDLSVRVYFDQADEVGEMATAFNNMAHQIEQYTDNLHGLVAERTKELRQTKEYFESIVESSADMIITTDRSGKITFANKATEKALGYPPDKLIGRHVSMCYVKGYLKAREIMDMLREKGSFSNYEMPLIAYDGTKVPILTSAALLRDEEGRVIGTVGVFTDITERKKLEATLRRTQASLVQAGKMRAMGDLVSGVAHELNNPLMASQSLVHVIKLGLEESDPNHRRIDIIGQCNVRMEKIINHLREFSRADEPQMSLIAFNRPIENTLMITGQQLLNHNVRLETSLAPDLPKILGDKNQLEQVFLNLIANAKDAMEGIDRPKVLTLKSFSEQTADGLWVKATVTDSGTGIRDEIMEKIFNPFFSTKETNKGTGLGLAITYGIIQDHMGTVEVKTRIGVGTTFTISIPAVEETQDDRPDNTNVEETTSMDQK